MACITWAGEQLDSGIFHVRDCDDVIEQWLQPGTVLIGANTAYDAAVIGSQFPEFLPKIFDKYRAGEILDVQIDQRLIDIAQGQLGGYTHVSPDEDPDDDDRGTRVDHKYSLSALHARYGFGELEKDEWRLKYGALIDVKITDWPAGAIAYAELDAVATMRVHLAQQEFATYLKDSACQARAAFALHLMSCRGIRTDPVACAKLADELEIEILRCRALCEQIVLDIPVKKIRSVKGVKTVEITPTPTAMVRRKPDGTYSKTAAVAQLYMRDACARAGVPVKITATGLKKKSTELEYVALDYEACNDSGDQVLAALSTYTSASTLRKKVERLKHGAHVPLQTRFTSLVATGRTASSKPSPPLIGDNFQNFGRNGLVTDQLDTITGQKHQLAGVRGCVIPRPGYAFVSVDCPNAEMRAMAQICIWTVGYSKLAEALNAGRDCHLALAATHLGIPYEDALVRLDSGDTVIADLRQFMKIPNFSLLGGASWRAMQPFAKRQKPSVILPDELAQQLYEIFHRTWSEIREYHNIIKAACRRGSTAFLQFVSERLRGDCPFTVACNTGFQGLTADAAKAALLVIANECYTGHMLDRTGESPLYGSYPVLHAHDENITETPIDRIHDAGHRLAELMVAPWNDLYTPDVQMSTKPAAMLRLAKEAKPVYDSDGRLQIWVPKQKVV